MPREECACRDKYDVPAPTVRRDKNDIDGLHYIVRNDLEELSPTQREIIHEPHFEEQPRDESAARRGMSPSTYDNHRKASCSRVRDQITAVVDCCAGINLPAWDDRIEEMNQWHAARQRRRASLTKEKRSSSGRDRSNFEGDPSNSRGDAEKNARARDCSICVSTKS